MSVNIFSERKRISALSLCSFESSAGRRNCRMGSAMFNTTLGLPLMLSAISRTTLSKKLISHASSSPAKD